VDLSEDTYKLYRTKTKDIIFRRNVYFNERSFPGRTLQPVANLEDDGTDLIGLDFEDDGIIWTVTKTGFFEGTPVLYYNNKENGEAHPSKKSERGTTEQYLSKPSTRSNPHEKGI
jgi:hypothetical protein